MELARQPVRTNIPGRSQFHNSLDLLNTNYCLFHISLSLNFWRYFNYFSTDLIQTYTSLLNVLDELCDEISGQSVNEQRFSPQTSIVKKVKKWPIGSIVKIYRFLQWKPMGNFFVYCPIQLKFCMRVRPKRLGDLCKYELNRQNNKNIIAKNSMTK